jgi:hypothetical protein
MKRQAVMRALRRISFFIEGKKYNKKHRQNPWMPEKYQHDKICMDFSEP